VVGDEIGKQENYVPWQQEAEPKKGGNGAGQKQKQQPHLDKWAIEATKTGGHPRLAAGWRGWGKHPQRVLISKPNSGETWFQTRKKEKNKHSTMGCLGKERGANIK